MKLTLNLLNDFITVIKYGGGGGIIRITWDEYINFKNFSRTFILDKNTPLDDLKLIPDNVDRNNMYVKFLNTKEMSLNDALNMIIKK